MSGGRMSSGHQSDSEDDFDDFDSSSESESYLQNLRGRLCPPSGEGDEDVEQPTAALNESLITEIIHSESEKDNADVKDSDVLNEDSSNHTSPVWEDADDVDSGSDPESDSWLNYQRDTSVSKVSPEKSVPVESNGTENVHPNQPQHLISPKKEKEDNDQTITNNIINGKNFKPVVYDVTEDNKSFVGKEKPRFVESNNENYYQSVQLIRKETFVKTVNNNVTKNSEELLIDKNIRKISPKVLDRRETFIKSVEEESPFLNRKFNSVSPKKKNISRTSLCENNSLAKSLGDNLNNIEIEVTERTEETTVDTNRVNKTTGSPEKRSRGKPAVPLRRDSYTKPKVRPKSEAFLSSVAYKDKDDDLCESKVSVSPSVLSLQSEIEKESERVNCVNVEGKGNRSIDKELDTSARISNFAFIRGSDPRVATCRGKLQNKRSKLNQEINKELRLRAGAENLFKATTNRKLKETVALELSFVNSNLQLLKEQLAELNSSVELYQGESPEPMMPMIPLGLKETKEIDFREPFKDFILEHYSEDGVNYEDAISELMDMRQAMRTPHRDASGVALLFQYYNQLYFVERRFFPPDRSLGIYFEWYDSLTGVPSCQRTVAFEKACVLFNIAALYTQLGAKQDRLNAKGLDQAVDNFLRAAGTFTYLHENFTNAPSMDLAPHMLDMLVQLMLAQARECLFEKLELQSRDKRDVDISLDLAQEAAQVSEVYCTVQTLISVSAVRDYVPYSWLSLVQVKREHYAALAHHHSAAGLLAHDLESLSARTKQALQLLHRDTDPRTQLDISEPHDNHERKLLGRAHLRTALMLHEEAERLLRMCRELRSKQALTQVLSKSRETSLTLYNCHTDKSDDFNDILDPPHIHASTKFQLSLTPPDFAQLKVEDLFKGLGPVAIFSAKHHWTAPRAVQLHRGDGEVGFGFSVRGDSPVIIAGVDHGSLAHFGGMKEGDFIVVIADKDVKWAMHEEVVRLIKDAGDSLSLKLVTPMDRNYLKQPTSSSQSSTHSKSSSSSQPSPSNTASSNKRLTWNPFRRQRERETSFNLILR